MCYLNNNLHVISLLVPTTVLTTVVQVLILFIKLLVVSYNKKKYSTDIQYSILYLNAAV